MKTSDLQDVTTSTNSCFELKKLERGRLVRQIERSKNGNATHQIKLIQCAAFSRILKAWRTSRLRSN
ncbi:MAG TPA: hypothetical protein PKE69_07000 [Pyrinomonadaceae bacterium]|nr:hypothetical protein [Pyrinomonadaceae bacterium]